MRLSKNTETSMKGTFITTSPSVFTDWSTVKKGIAIKNQIKEYDIKEYTQK